MTTSPSKNLLQQWQTRAETALDNLLPPADSRLHQAMRYAALGGGKRLRAALIFAAGEALNADQPALDYAAAAMEAIHAYSLIHDDLPAMDDDDLRRGRPSTHKAFDEAEAILAGDALNTLAFELLAQSPLPPAVKTAQILALAQAAGSRGMAGGQSLDIANTGRAAALETLERIHHNKTGALITASLYLGALPAADYSRYAPLLTELGSTLGLAYQIQDDILDATQSTEALGKTAGKDQAQQKNTYLSLLGLAEAENRLADAQHSISRLLGQLPNPEPLSRLIAAIFSRRH